MTITDPPASVPPKQADAPTAWLIRAGSDGEFAVSFIENRIAAVDFGQVGDLSEVLSQDEVVALVKEDWPDASDREAGARARQLWTFRSKIRPDDMVVMPREGGSEYALGIVKHQYSYRHDASSMRHAVTVAWRATEVSHTDMTEDFLKAFRPMRPTVNQIQIDKAAQRLQQLMETGQDPGPQAGSGGEESDLADLVARFREETGFPTDAHREQERLRKEWAGKLASANVASLSREDLLAYTSNAVHYGDYVDRGEGRRQQWIIDLDDAGYDRLLDSIRDLCWGPDELSARIDRLVDRVGGFNTDTGTLGFTGIQVSRTLAICFPEKFLPFPSQIGKWGREPALRALGLPESQGSYGQRVVDANDRLREHLLPFFEKDTQGMAAFLLWLKKIWQEADSGEGGEPGGKPSGLSDLIALFHHETGYPTEAHKEQERLRAEWAEKLAPANVASLSREDLNSYANAHTVSTGRYVRPLGRVTQKWIRELSESQYSRLLESIRDLCWGEGDLAARIDRLVDETGSYRRGAGTKGFSGSNVSTTLAICRPERFLPVPTQGGKWGRTPMLRELGLPKPPDSTFGQRVLDANDRLRAHLSPYLHDDPLTIGTFLGWLMERVNTPSKQPTSGDTDPGGGAQELEAVADELLVDPEFLEDIVELLEDKGQVILYGPPGTGKTYLARELAEVLAPDESRRALVQFHPSTSYEDFFEGYRPAGADSGGISYKLTPGPLARMAELASRAPGQRHVMIIDEINRGNLPRVLGELLFLLEYRDESVRTLYRPKKPFSLPDNLWFIGTMNTADRSIALVDAALRRRFHFVPFFPDSGPMAGLLARWLKREHQPDWIGRLVDAVNDELTRELGGSHLLLGPSHFMREFGPSLAEQRQQLRRIWKYNIEPFIEDQFFGNPEQIDSFRFDAVMRRHGPAAEPDADVSDDDDGGNGDDHPEGTGGSGDEPAVVDGEAADEEAADEPGSTPPEHER